ARVYRIDLPGVTEIGEQRERLPADACGVARHADHGDAAGVEEAGEVVTGCVSHISVSHRSKENRLRATGDPSRSTGHESSVTRRQARVTALRPGHCSAPLRRAPGPWL